MEVHMPSTLPTIIWAAITLQNMPQNTTENSHAQKENKVYLFLFFSLCFFQIENTEREEQK